MDRSSLFDDLAAWSIVAPLKPVPPQPDFEQWSRHLADVFRYFASVNDQWLWQTIETHPEDVLALSPWIGSVEVLGFNFPPPSMTWCAWIDSLDSASLIPFASSLSAADIELMRERPVEVKEKIEIHKSTSLF